MKVSEIIYELELFMNKYGDIDTNIVACGELLEVNSIGHTITNSNKEMIVISDLDFSQFIK